MKRYTPAMRYALVVAASFSLFGIRLLALRGISAIAAAAALPTTYRLARRLGLSAAAAFVGSAFLCADVGFLRAARVGRMDMLALALIVGSLLAAAGAGRRAPLYAGLLAALAGLTHPIGLVALPGALLTVARRRIFQGRGDARP